MFSFNVRTRQNVTNSPRSTNSPSNYDSPKRPQGTPENTTSPKVEVGEIDTSAPFNSVRAALSLFAADTGRSPKESQPMFRRTKSGEDRVLEKETQHHLTIKKLEYLQEHLRSTEAIKHQARKDLDKANRTLENLTNKLETASESKQAAILATEVSKKRIKELEERESSKAQVGGGDTWKSDVDSERNQYKASSAQLISAKQELTNLRQDFDAALEAKLNGFHQAADAQHTTQVNRERMRQLSSEIRNMRETLNQVELTSQKAQEEHVKVISEKEARIQSHRTAKEEIDKKLEPLREEFRLGYNDNIKEKLDGTNEAITLLQEQLNTVHASDQNSLRSITSELESAKKEHHEILSEENMLKSLVDSLKVELENVKREQLELVKAAEEAEIARENLQIDLERLKKELEAINAGEIELKHASHDTYINIQQLTSEGEAARQEAEEYKNNIILLRCATESSLLSTKEIEEQLQVVLIEAEKAKAAEKLVNDEIRNSSRKDSTEAINSDSTGKIKLSSLDYETLSKKVENTKADADMKVGMAMAQVKTIRDNATQSLDKIEVGEKEIQNLEAAISDALKQAEMSDGAKQIVEGELRRWREKEQSEIEEEDACIQLGGAS